MSSRPRIRVLTLIDRLGPLGGAERLALQIALGLDPERFESHFCASRHSAADRASALAQRAQADLEAAGVRFLGVPRETKADIWKWSRLWSYLRRERIDVLHAHKHGSNVWGTAVGRAARVPVIVAHEHSWSYEGQRLRVVLDRELVARGADALVAVSREDQRRMTAVERIPPERTRFVPNGSVASAPSRSAGEVRAELGIAADTLVVVTAGALCDYKGFDVLVDAAARLAPRFGALRVLIAGEGEQRPALEAQIARRGLDGVVTLLGHRPDVADVLAAADVAVCCSHHEGSPLSVMEYMEAGLPVVASRVGGVPDLLDDGVHGLLVTPRDPDALSEALATVLADPRRRAEMGEAGRARRRAEFDLSVTIGRLQDLYEELLARRSR